MVGQIERMSLCWNRRVALTWPSKDARPQGKARGRAREKTVDRRSVLGLVHQLVPGDLLRDRRAKPEDVQERRPWIADQFLALSTSLFLAIHGIMPRSFSPTCSIWWLSFMRRMPLKRDSPERYSCIHSDVNLPVWMSLRMRFISALVSAVMMRGPETYSPHSAVLEIE